MPSSRAPRVAPALLALLLAACDRGGPTIPGAAPDPVPGLDVSDGATNGGTPGFYFLPPLVPQPAHAGAADGTLQPRVTVCEWRADLQRCAAVVADFATHVGTGAETVRYDPVAQHYVVNWDTRTCVAGPCALDPAKAYRVRVAVGAAPLGHADVRVVETGSQLRNAQTGEAIALLNGRTLPVKFRVEQGAVAVVGPGAAASVGTGGGTVASADGGVALAIPAGALGGTTAIAVATPAAYPAGTIPGLAPIVDLGPDGTRFAKPVTITLPFDPSRLPAGVPGSALAIYTADGMSGWREVPGSVADPATATVTAPITHFSIYTISIRPNTITGTPTPTTIAVGQTTTLTAHAVGFRTTGGQTQCYPTFSDVRAGGLVWHRTVVGSTCSTAPAEPLFHPAVGQAVFWSSVDPTRASVSPAPTYTNASGDAQSPPVLGVSAGGTAITATASGVAAVCGITVTPPPLGTLRLAGLSPTMPGDAAPAVLLYGPDGSPTGASQPTTVTFTPSPNVQVFDNGLGAPITSAVIGAGQGIVVFVIHQLAPGPASLTVSAPGWGSATYAFTFTRPQVQTFRIPWPASIVGEVTLPVYTADENGDGFGVMEPTTVTFVTSPNLQVLDGDGHPTASTLVGRSAGYFPVRLRRTAPGPVSLTLSAAGWVAKTYVTVPTFEVEGMPPTQVGDRVYAIKQVDDAGSPFGRTVDTPIALATSPNLQLLRDAVSLTPLAGATIPAGQGLVLVIGHQLAPGPASLTLSAPGFAPRTYATTLAQPVGPTFAIRDWPATLDSTATLDIRTVDAAGNGFGVSAFTEIAMETSPNARVEHLFTAEPMTTAFYRPTQGQVIVRLRRLGAGPVTLRVSAPGYAAATFTAASP